MALRERKPKFSAEYQRRQEEAELTDHVDVDYGTVHDRKSDAENIDDKQRKYLYPYG